MLSKSDILGWLDIATKAGAVCATISLVGSVVYDWAYLRELGLGFSDLPTSLTDHIRTALVWLPRTIFWLTIGLLIELQTRRIERWQTEDQIVASAVHPTLVRRFRASPYVALVFGAWLLVAAYVLLGEPFRLGLPAALFVILTHFVWRQIRHSNTPRAAILAFGLVWPVALFLTVVFMSGREAAHGSVKRSTPSHTIVVRNPETTTLKVALFRPFERGVLVKPVQESSVRFLRWEAIDSVTMSPAETGFTGVLCWWWPRLCPSPSSHSTDVTEDAL